MKLTPLKQFFNNLKASCHNPNNPRYPTYGGAGIKIDPRWLVPGGNGYRTMLDDFDFTQDDDEITSGYIRTIQRYDTTKDFTPDNCFLSEHSMSGVPLKDQPALSAYYSDESDAAFNLDTSNPVPPHGDHLTPSEKGDLKRELGVTSHPFKPSTSTSTHSSVDSMSSFMDVINKPLPVTDQPASKSKTNPYELPPPDMSKAIQAGRERLASTETTDEQMEVSRQLRKAAMKMDKQIQKDEKKPKKKEKQDE